MGNGGGTRRHRYAKGKDAHHLDHTTPEEDGVEYAGCELVDCVRRQHHEQVVAAGVHGDKGLDPRHR
jgi:hypothetical protein